MTDNQVAQLSLAYLTIRNYILKHPNNKYVLIGTYRLFMRGDEIHMDPAPYGDPYTFSLPIFYEIIMSEVNRHIVDIIIKINREIKIREIL